MVTAFMESEGKRMRKTFFAMLRGSEEVPPVNTNASGTFSAVMTRDGRQLFYTLKVNRIRNMTQGHLHLGARGVNGPVVALLFRATPGVSVNRSVIKGTLTAADLTGPLKGRPLSDLVRLINTGKIYCNVHTEQNPNGEIRGQVRRLRK
jgi:hypothetical protein